MSSKTSFCFLLLCFVSVVLARCPKNPREIVIKELEVSEFLYGKTATIRTTLEMSDISSYEFTVKKIMRHQLITVDHANIQTSIKSGQLSMNISVPDVKRYEIGESQFHQLHFSPKWADDCARFSFYMSLPHTRYRLTKPITMATMTRVPASPLFEAMDSQIKAPFTIRMKKTTFDRSLFIDSTGTTSSFTTYGYTITHLPLDNTKSMFRTISTGSPNNEDDPEYSQTIKRTFKHDLNNDVSEFGPYCINMQYHADAPHLRELMFYTESCFDVVPNGAGKVIYSANVMVNDHFPDRYNKVVANLDYPLSIQLVVHAYPNPFVRCSKHEGDDWVDLENGSMEQSTDTIHKITYSLPKTSDSLGEYKCVAGFGYTAEFGRTFEIVHPSF